MPQPATTNICVGGEEGELVRVCLCSALTQVIEHKICYITIMNMTGNREAELSIDLRIDRL